MSKIGIISQEYKNTAGLFQQINQAVITLKKDFYGNNSIESQTVDEARHLLSNILANILIQLDSSSVDSTLNEQHFSIPPFFIQRLQEKNQGNFEWYLEDLRKLQLILNQSQALNEELLNILDEICEQLDAETTKLYRKMRRR